MPCYCMPDSVCVLRLFHANHTLRRDRKVVFDKTQSPYCRGTIFHATTTTTTATTKTKFPVKYIILKLICVCYDCRNRFYSCAK